MSHTRSTIEVSYARSATGNHEGRVLLCRAGLCVARPDAPRAEDLGTSED